jgi:hypothetical protein
LEAGRLEGAPRFCHRTAFNLDAKFRTRGSSGFKPRNIQSSSLGRAFKTSGLQAFTPVLARIFLNQPETDAVRALAARNPS